MKYSINATVSKNGNMNLLFNSLTGTSTKITSQCLDVVNYAIDNNLSPEELMPLLADEEDRNYFSQLFDLLFNLGIIVNKDITETNHIEAVTIELTHRCNLYCKHCSLSAGTMSDKELFSTEQEIALIDQILKFRPNVIIVTGGEPMVRSDFWDIINYIKENSEAKLGIMTNATLINEENVDKLAQTFYSFDLSLDGVNEETCSKIRGKNVFGRVMKAVSLLKEKNVQRITLSMVDVAVTHAYIDDFKKLNYELGTTPMIRCFEKQGRGLENADLLDNISITNLISKEEMYKIADKLGKEKRERRDGFSCCGGRTDFFVDYKGDLYPCAPLQNPEFKITSLVENKNIVEDVISFKYRSTKGYSNLNKLMPFESTECSDCPYNMFCWSCLHDFYEVKKDPEYFKFRCDLKKKELECMWG